MPKYPKKSRSFTFTTYDFSVDYQELIDRDSCGVRYIAYGDETCPSTKRRHQQGWICFHNQRSTKPTSLKTIGGMLGNAHVEPMLGSIKQNTAYCAKEGSLHQFGDKPNQGSRGDLKDVVDRIARGQDTADRICMDDPIFYHQYGRTLTKAEDVALRQKYRTWMTKGIWYWGVTGVGKSHTAFKDFNPNTHYVKPLQDEWWDGYTGQETVILNDFRGQLTYSEMLQLVDKWPHSVKRRNREPAPFLAKTVIVTSALNIGGVYNGIATQDDNIAQLERRFDEIEMAERFEVVDPGSEVV